MIKKQFIITCLNLLLAFSLYCQESTKTIKGVILDSRSGGRLANVKIYPACKDDTVFSDPVGRFKIQIPSDFYDILHFNYPGYYPYLFRIKKGTNLHLQKIGLISKSLDLDTVFYPTLKENRTIYARVLDEQTKIPIYNSVVNLDSNTKIGYSDRKGMYRICLPKNTDSLIISHPDYYPSTVNVPESTHENPKDVFLKPLLQIKRDDFWKEEKNSVRLVVGDLLKGSVSIDYERFVKMKHAVGLRTSAYLFEGIIDVAPFQWYIEDYNGIKLSAYYRFYDTRTMRKGFFYEAKISWGYFDFDGIYYKVKNHSEYGKYFTEISNSLGFGGSIGWMIRLVPGPVLNISVGGQYFPLNVPKTQNGYLYNDYLEFVLDDNFWKYGGPGSIIELKFMIGGIF